MNSIGRQQPSVSWLKFDPKVSNFPATKTAIAVLVACAIMTIFLFFYLFLLLFAKVVQSMWRALHQWAVVCGRMMSVWRNASVFETPNRV